MKQIVVSNIPIELERKKIKNMYLKVVPPDGRIRISAPLRMSSDEIERFVAAKLDWIRQQQSKLADRHTHQVSSYEDGEELYCRGRKYRLAVMETASRPEVCPEGDRLVLYTKENSTPESRKKAIDRWYREVLAKEIPPLLHKWEKIIGVKAEGFSIRDMKTRWGTCNIRSRNICLNLQLAKKPPECLEYVVVHELVHLLEKSHNSVFKAYLDRFLPGWRSIKKELNGGR
jgi:predicted metal-dependent hydrolase